MMTHKEWHATEEPAIRTAHVAVAV